MKKLKKEIIWDVIHSSGGVWKMSWSIVDIEVWNFLSEGITYRDREDVYDVSKLIKDM